MNYPGGDVDSDRGAVGAAAGAAGRALGAVFGTLARVRPAPKPLHPIGFQVSGVMHRHGGPPQRGVPWLDEPGTDGVLVRFSRAVGLPRPVPDILGLALRIRTSQGDADLLLATTGAGTLSRFALLPRNDVATTYGSLMAYRTPTGPLWFFASVPDEEPSRIAVSVSGPRGPWVAFADVQLDGEPRTDPPISFDPVANPLPGLQLYAWERRMRHGAYASARAARN